VHMYAIYQLAISDCHEDNHHCYYRAGCTGKLLFSQPTRHFSKFLILTITRQPKKLFEKCVCVCVCAINELCDL